MSQRARFCQRREALQKLQHRARRLPDDIVSKPRSVVQRDDELQIKVRTPPRPSGYCARSSPVEDSPSPDPESRVPDISCDSDRDRDGSTPGNRLDTICEEEKEKEEAICGEEEDAIFGEEEEDAICGEKDADCEKEEDAICGEEEDADCEEEEDAICGEKDAICEEEDANCGEEKDANCGEEEHAICGEEDANCGEEDASFDDVDLESLSSNQSEYIRGKDNSFLLISPLFTPHCYRLDFKLMEERREAPAGRRSGGGSSAAGSDKRTQMTSWSSDKKFQEWEVT
ncbi:hypothetical protein Bbelb_379210 [Branchiostoma belcheri]|nr:hypothetical protein Bbelb_379210 [Branchiostoma belcheri]